MLLTWKDVLHQEKTQPYFQNILTNLSVLRQQGKVIYPPQHEIFNAFMLTEFYQVKVVLLGQDPYHGQNQAHGLAFSVNKGIKIPPSLLNIYKELADDIAGFNIPAHGCLIDWAKQGVLLLNSVLTVEHKTPNSHAQLGWEIFTDTVIQKLSEQKKNLIFLLWGAYAQKKVELIAKNNNHLILTTTHPSPFSAHRGFLGCKHFSKTNQFLTRNKIEPINWQI